MSYIDRKRHGREREPITQAPANRFSFLGAGLMMVAVPVARWAKSSGWVASVASIEIVLGLLGAGCIFGAWIAYRSTQEQVARDLADLKPHEQDGH